MSVFYLDNAATTPVLEEVLEKALPFLTENFANPSSAYGIGVDVMRAVKDARSEVAKAFGVRSDRVIFCSGGTEANHQTFLNAAHSPRLHGKQFIFSAIEHPSVLNMKGPLEALGFQVDLVSVTPEGIVDLEHLKSLLSEETRLVSCMAVNNELGTIQPLEAISKMVKQQNPSIVFHVDAIQAVTKIELPTEHIDVLSLSGHKIGAPKGIGAMVFCQSPMFDPFLQGGGQEFGWRSGTHNVFGIVALGEAVRLGMAKQKEVWKQMEACQKKWKKFLKDFPSVIRYESPHQAPHFLNLAIPNVPAEVFLHHLEAEGVYVSAGSACSSRKTSISHVLQAVGLPQSTAKSLIRISLSCAATPESTEPIFEKMKVVFEQLKDFSGSPYAF